MTDTRAKACLHCNCTDDDKPLVVLTLGSQPAHICPQCLPILIHHPDKLTRILLDRMESSRNTEKP